MQHTFIPYLPATADADELEDDQEEEKKYENEDDDQSVELSDLEFGGGPNQKGKKDGIKWSKHEVCFICQNKAAVHD